MKIFRVPIYWEVYGYYEFHAQDLEEAIRYIREGGLDALALPPQEGTIDDSWEYGEDEECEEFEEEEEAI